MDLRRSGEDYLEAIYMLKRQKGVVRSIDVAHHLDYSKPSVSRAVGLLKRDGYLEMRENGELELTRDGLAAAAGIYERHTILTALFISLGVRAETAAVDACQVEHVISDETFQRLKATHQDRVRQLGLTGDGDIPTAGGKKAARPAKKKKKRKE